MVYLQVKKTHKCFFKKMLVFVKMSGNDDIISFWCLLCTVTCSKNLHLLANWPVVTPDKMSFRISCFLSFYLFIWSYSYDINMETTTIIKQTKTCPRFFNL